MPIITVPTVPEGMMPSSYRRVVTGIHVSRSGRTTTLLPDDGSQWLAAGDVVEVPAGTVVLAVDKTHAGFAAAHESGERYATYAPTVTVLTVAEDGTLGELYRRAFKTPKSVMSATVLGKLRAAVEGSPVAGLPVLVRVLAEARRPNRDAAACRWCGEAVRAGTGHLYGHGDTARVEHWLECPSRPTGREHHRAPCSVCGVSVHHTLGVWTVDRTAAGPAEDGPVVSVRHRPDLDCGSRPQAAAELIDAELAVQDAERRELEAAARATVAKRQAAAAKRKADAAEKRRRKQELERRDAEAARERMETVGVSHTDPAKILYDKGLGGGLRMRLTETVAHLAGVDGGTVTYWTVTCPGLDIDERYWLLGDARTRYQGYAYDPNRGRVEPSPVRRPGPAACPGRDVQHCDHCGSTVAPGGWMVASLGLACDTGCHDAMSDRRGRHDRAHHSGW